MYDWDLSSPVLNAWIKLRQASEAMDKVLEVELAKKQTSLTPVAILALLSVSKVPLTPNKLGGYVFREIHSVSQLLKRMVRYGYVKKKRSDKDQRVVRVKMERKGEELLKQAMPVALGNAHNILRSCLSDEEIEQLDRLSEKVRDRALEALGKKAEPLPDTVDIAGRVPQFM